MPVPDARRDPPGPPRPPVDDGETTLPLTSVVHHLTQPLSAIVAGVETIGRTPLPDRARRALGAMERACERMVRLVEDLQLLSRVSDPENRLALQPVDLRPIVREVSELSEVAARERDLSLRVRTPPFTRVAALGDPVDLDRVVVNLVNNAVKYTDRGGSITIGLRPAPDEAGMVELVVADDGIGISAEDRDHIFTEFYRSPDPAVRARPGTGLGLSIVDHVVRRHGGRIEVDSESGRGTTFRVLLPAAEDDGAPTPGPRVLRERRGRLVAMLSHELKNPLTVLLANRDLLEPDLGDAAARAALADIDANAQRVGRIVDDMLQLARLADPGAPLVAGDVDLRALLEEVAAGLDAASGGHPSRLDLALPQAPVPVRGDAEELRSLLVNVIANAVGFSEDGGRVTVAVLPPEGNGTDGADEDRDEVAVVVAVVVADQGAGLTPQDADRLFTDFFRSEDPAALPRSGSGLGLAIARRVLHRHGGRVEVESVLGEGTTLRLWLPRA
jgi:signal transduction histidine kinase